MLGCQVLSLFGVLFAVSSVWMACCLVSSVCLVGGCNFLGLRLGVLADFGRESVSSVWLRLPLCWHFVFVRQGLPTSVLLALVFGFGIVFRLVKESPSFGLTATTIIFLCGPFLSLVVCLFERRGARRTGCSTKKCRATDAPCDLSGGVGLGTGSRDGGRRVLKKTMRSRT